MARHQAPDDRPRRSRDLRPLPAPPPPPPPHRRRRRGWLVLAVAAVLVVGATVYVAVDQSGSPSPRGPVAAAASTSAAPTCHPTGPQLRVVAASGIAPVVTAAADAACLDVRVDVDDTTKPAAGLRAGDADVWIPDSRERGYLAVGAAVGSAPSLATSPLVMVASSTVAGALAQGSAAKWSVLLDPSALAPVTASIQDPAVSGASLVLAGALAGVGTTVARGNKNTGVAAAAGALHALKTVPAATIDRLPTTQIDVVEQRFAPSGASGEAVQVPTAEGLPFLDYPLVTLPTPTASAAAADLLTALKGPAAMAARDKAGLLAPGTGAVDLATSATPLRLLPQVAATDVPTSIAIADTSSTPVSVLAVLDVSGSMADAAPGQQAPIDVVRASAQTFFTTFGRGVDLGLWEFGHQLAPPSDHVEVFPIQPFASSQARLGPAIAAVQAQRTGTALYQTTLDAYRTVQAKYKTDAANLVVLFTDGRNEDAPGLDLPGLLTALKAQADPKRPVQVIFFGYGAADIASMTAITAVTGGGVYPIASSADIVGAFIRASGQIAAAGS